MIETPIDVLLIDDNPNDMDLSAYALKRSEAIHCIQTARDGVEALDFLFCTGAYAGRSQTNLPRLILLDLKLPRLDGWDVLRRVKADPRTQHIPVVVLTSSSDQNDIARCYQLGANSFIVKPVDYDEFLQAARILGAYWLTLNHLPSG
ncbi:MAG TPA: response regulator [Anaerolineaceae bacterium]|jgi:two-component system response regulator